jgi:hypothetical protein
MSSFSPTIEDLLYAREHNFLTDSIGQAVRRSIEFDVAGEFEHSVLADALNGTRYPKHSRRPHHSKNLSWGPEIFARNEPVG